MIEFTLITTQERYSQHSLKGNIIFLDGTLYAEKINASGALFIQGHIKDSTEIQANYDGTFLYAQQDIGKHANIYVGEGIICKGTVQNGAKLMVSRDGYIHIHDKMPEARIDHRFTLYKCSKNNEIIDNRTYKSEPYPYVFLAPPQVAQCDLSQTALNFDGLQAFLKNYLANNTVVNANPLLDKRVTLDIYEVLPLFCAHRKDLDLNTMKLLGAAIEYLKGNNRLLQIERIRGLALSPPADQNAVSAWQSVKSVTAMPAIPTIPAVAPRQLDQVDSLDQYLRFKLQNLKNADVSGLVAPEIVMDAYDILQQYEGKKAGIESAELLFMGAAIQYLKNQNRPLQVKRFKDAADMAPPSHAAIFAYAMARYESYFVTNSSDDLTESVRYLEKIKDVAPFVRLKYDEIKHNLSPIAHPPQSNHPANNHGLSLTLPVYKESDFDWDKKQQVGDGGSALVFKASDKRFSSSVYAVKLFKQGATEQSIVREASHMLTIQHELIVRIYGGFVAAHSTTLCGFVMEFMAGGSLYDKLHPKEGRFEADMLIKFKMGIELATALAWLHSREYLHRDLKSPNVMVAADGTLKLTDFGISKDASKQNTTTQYMKGTLAWMAPELFDNKPHTKQSDVYALAMILWEIDTGDIPYKNATDTAIVKQKIMHEILPTQDRSPFAPLIKDGLNGQPAERKEALYFMNQLSRARDNYKLPSAAPPAQAAYQTSGVFLK